MSPDVHVGVAARESPLLGRIVAVCGLGAGHCPFRCAYCSAPPARATTSRRNYHDAAAVVRAVDEVWEAASPVDHIIVGGHGDPLLWTGCGDFFRRLRARHAAPLVVLTPGPLLTRATIRGACAHASLIVAKLDAGTPREMLAVNRHHRGIRFRRVTEALADFGRRFPGRLWVQTVLIAGLNDGPQSCRMIARTVAGICPSTLVLAGPRSEAAHSDHEAWRSIPPGTRLVVEPGGAAGTFGEDGPSPPSCSTRSCWAL